MTGSITIPKLADMHVHLRRDEMLRSVISATARVCEIALVMPNTKPGIYTGADAQEYRTEIMRNPGTSGLRLVMSIYITPNTTPEMIYTAREWGVSVGKVYPKDLTTNAEDGVKDYRALAPVYEAMEKCGMVLSLHGESPGEYIYYLEREVRFLPTLSWLAETYPDLKIVMEHITTRAAVDYVAKLGPNVAATITLHHLMIYGNMVMEPKLHPHLFCKPLAKRHSDMRALIRAALSGNPKYFLGSDTAPHHRSTKECAECCAGVYTAPVLAQLLVQFFHSCNAMGKMANFASYFGPAFYGIPKPEGTIKLVQSPWSVPEWYPVHGHHDDPVVPFMAGKKLSWQVVD